MRIQIRFVALVEAVSNPNDYATEHTIEDDVDFQRLWPVRVSRA